MPINQLHIIEKIRHLVARAERTNRQILIEAESDARTHRLAHQKQESEDEQKVSRAAKNVKAENAEQDDSQSLLPRALKLGLIALLVLAAALLAWRFLFS